MRVPTLRDSNYWRPGIILLALVTVLTSIAGYRAMSRASLEQTPQARNVWRLTPGDRLSYDLRYESDSYSDLQALYGSIGAAADRDSQRLSKHAYRVTVDATVVLTAIRRNGTSIVAGYRFTNARINAESEMGSMIDSDRVQLELARDTFCEIDEDGRIGSLMFDPAQSGATTNFVRALLGPMQFAKPAGASDQNWEIEEDDSSGAYRAQYVSTPETSASSVEDVHGVRRFRKTKLEYLPPAADDERELPEAPKAILPDAAFDLTFDFDNGRILDISGFEAQTILLAGKIVGGAHNRFQLRFLNEDKASKAEIASAADELRTRSLSADAIALSAGPSEHAQVAAAQREQLGDDSFETLKPALDAIEQGSETLSYSQLYAKVKALLFLHPEVCAELGNVLQSVDPTGLAAQLITGALAAVGSAEAQESLIGVIRTRRADAATVQPLIIALGEVKRPTQSAQDIVEEMAWQAPGSAVARAAQLELGSMAHNLRRRSPVRAAEIVEHAANRLSVAGTETQLIDLLGNSGVAEALPVLERFLDDPSSELRARAALALRFIDGEQADERLARMMTSDPDESVRLQAATAFEFRNNTQTTLQAQTSALFSDASLSVRMRVMNNLWKSHEDYPEVIASMERVSASDPSKDVRAAAARLLASR